MNNAPNQAMQLTASKPDVYAWGVCRRKRMLRGMRRGLAAAVDSFIPMNSPFGAARPCRTASRGLHSCVSLGLLRALDPATWHVLLAIADDWESIVQIQGTLRRFAFDIPDAAVFDTLRELYRDGYIKLMGPDGQPSSAFPDDPTQYWFYFTPAGEQLWASGDAQFRRPDPADE